MAHLVDYYVTDKEFNAVCMNCLQVSSFDARTNGTPVCHQVIPPVIRIIIQKKRRPLNACE